MYELREELRGTLRIAVVVLALAVVYGVGVGVTHGLGAKWNIGAICYDSGREDSLGRGFGAMLWPVGLPIIVSYRVTAGTGEPCVPALEAP